MDKRKRGKAVVGFVIVVALLAAFLYFFVKDDSPQESGSTASNTSPPSYVPPPPNDSGYTIQEYIGPSVEEILAQEVSDEEKASKLYLHGSQKLITKLYDKAAVYYDAALNLEGISEQTRNYITYERYALAAETKDEATKSKLAPLLTQQQIDVIGKIYE